MKKSILLLTAAAIISTSSSTEANKLDAYRDIIASGSFTIHYELEVPPIKETSREGILTQQGLANSKGIMTIENLQNHPFSGIVVIDGSDRYVESSRDILKDEFTPEDDSEEDKTEEVILKRVGICRLIKDGEVFNFHYTIKKDGVKDYRAPSRSIFSSGSHKIKAENSGAAKAHSYLAMLEEYNYGSVALSKTLIAMYPPQKIIQTDFTPEYTYLESGNLKNGLSYEDYVSNVQGIIHAARYYFDGDKLVKAKVVAYADDVNGEMGYEKTIIKFHEFVQNPDKSLLKLPDSLKDITKREEQEELEKKDTSDEEDVDEEDDDE